MKPARLLVASATVSNVEPNTNKLWCTWPHRVMCWGNWRRTAPVSNPQSERTHKRHHFPSVLTTQRMCPPLTRVQPIDKRNRTVLLANLKCPGFRRCGKFAHWWDILNTYLSRQWKPMPTACYCKCNSIVIFLHVPCITKCIVFLLVNRSKFVWLQKGPGSLRT